MSLPSPAKQPAPVPALSLKPGERRTKERKRQRLIDGFISSGNMPTPRPCTICDMSVGGSKVELWSGTDTPKPLQRGDRVTLYIPGDRKEVDAEVRWRKDNAIGLRFLTAFRAPRRSYG